MPRVAKPPRGNGESSKVPIKQAAGTQIRASPIKIPLNDDAREKAVRLQSRQALHDLQMNQLKAAASPRRRLNPHERAASTSPKTPKTIVAGRGKENDHGLVVVGSSALTPMKRVPILANFEEWMKMATDNKINATNSWNFALIDYFHDMTLLKEGDGVNFQKASCTLDGCVKIYTSRVDSVATETGKLLSGLADSGNKKRRGEDEREGGDDCEEDDEEGEEGSRKRGKRRAQHSSEATLAPSFTTLQLKKFELEFSVDPLFKKASADFDEGGAKGLLLNHLSIDAQGRIVFDSSDDARNISEETERRRRSSNRDNKIAEDGDGDADTDYDSELKEAETEGEEAAEIDVVSLGAKFFPDLNRLDNQDICPSLKNFDLGDMAGSLDIPFLKAPEDWRQERNRSVSAADQSGIFLDGENPLGFDDDDDGALGGFDLPPDTGFGEGGEAWARGADLEPQNRFVNDDNIEEDGIGGEEGQVIGAFDAGGSDYIVSLNQGKEGGAHEDILSYFDQALRKNWAGPEHWRIRRIKDVTKSSPPPTRTRKEKEPFEIDFSSPLNPILAETIYTPTTTMSSISLPKTQWKSKTRNLLPDDKHFNSRQLLRLFLKPKARMGSKRKGFGHARSQQSHTQEGDVLDEEMDEAFWARKEGPAGTAQDGENIQGNYDANFFQDDGPAFLGGADDDDDEFADAREHFSPALEGEEGAVTGSVGIADVLAAGGQDAFGNQLVTQSKRLRPEYVQYARVAKKVDVRRLKEEMWKGMGIGDDLLPPQTPPGRQLQPIPKPADGSLTFTSIINSLQSVYPAQAMADISTSYCFICLLHLANEKGLVLEDIEGLTELNIKIDPSAEITEGAE
ncbi:hypothetical protein FGG08_006842 [Glutinoglossum americanum]|uniref:Condensin complex subunit 2 n=1 Tax=Glutinoglossum americanum TaxID=1670608 RepID=A0A9P8HV64_9PEZI|nr:hypothetical protein FGG08_006842 [Glutinoglossum americanum]